MEDGSIWGISGSLMPVDSIINCYGRYMHSWDTKISCKGIIEAVINRPIVLLQC